MSSQPKTFEVVRLRRPAREIVTALVAECGKFGVTPTLHRKTKHLSISFEYLGHKGTLSLPCTPSDHRSSLNVLSKLRCALKEIERRAA